MPGLLLLKKSKYMKKNNQFHQWVKDLMLVGDLCLPIIVPTMGHEAQLLILLARFAAKVLMDK